MDSNLLNKAKAGDEAARNQFLEMNKKYIHRYACLVCKRYLSWENDDELSVALMAFNNAIDSFKEGEFEYYSKMIIKHKLIDYFRKNNRNEVPIEDVEIQNNLQYVSPIDEQIDRATQIIIFKEILQKFNINISDLASNSPKHRDTREKLMDMATEISVRKDMVEQIINNKMLPIKEILTFINVSRKMLEEWRKYIIALIIILSDKRLDSLRDFIL